MRLLLVDVNTANRVQSFKTEADREAVKDHSPGL
jgi:hypothetical protein